LAPFGTGRAAYSHIPIFGVREDKVKIIYTTCLAILFVLTACNRTDRERAGAAPEATTTAEQMKHQRDDYVKAVDAKLAEFDQKFDGLDARARSMTGTAKEDIKGDISQLREDRKGVSKKLGDLKNVSLDSWLTMKAEVDAAVANLETTYEQVSTTHETVPAAAPNTQRR
jgi:hypothetical protein